MPTSGHIDLNRLSSPLTPEPGDMLTVPQHFTVRSNHFPGTSCRSPHYAQCSQDQPLLPCSLFGTQQPQDSLNVNLSMSMRKPPRTSANILSMPTGPSIPVPCSLQTSLLLFLPPLLLLHWSPCSQCARLTPASRPFHSLSLCLKSSSLKH